MLPIRIVEIINLYIKQQQNYGCVVVLITFLFYYLF